MAVAEVERKCHAHERARSFVSVGMTDREVGVARRGGGNLCAHVIKKRNNNLIIFIIYIISLYYC